MRSFGGKNFSLKPFKLFYFLNKFKSEMGEGGPDPPNLPLDPPLKFMPKTPQWYMIMVFFFSVSGTDVLGKKNPSSPNRS